MMAIPVQLIILSLVVWSFFDAIYGPWTYIGCFAIFYYIQKLYYKTSLTKRVSNVDTSKFDLTPQEEKAFITYPARVIYPFASVGIGAVLSTMQGASFVLTPWLLYKGEYPQAAILVVSYLLSGPLSFWYNPSNLLQKRAVATNSIEDELMIEGLEGAIKKINGIKPPETA